MRGLKSLGVSAALVVALFGMTTPSSADGVPDEQWVQMLPSPAPNEVPMWGIKADAKTDLLQPWPHLLGFTVDKMQRSHGPSEGNAKVSAVAQCASLTDAACTNANFIHYEAVLPSCESSGSVDCVSAITALDVDGNPLKVRMAGVALTGGTLAAFPGSPSLHLPQGNAAVLFTVDGVTHNGGDLFAAVVKISGDKFANEATFSVNDFRASVFAVKLVQGQFTVAQPSRNVVDYTNWDVGQGGVPGNGGSDCAVATATTCALRYALPTDIQFGMDLKLSTPISGWFHGRFKDPRVSVSIDSQGMQHVSLLGTAIHVPTVYGWIEKSKATPELKDYIAYMANMLGPGIGGGNGYGCLRDPCLPENWVSTQQNVWPNYNGMKLLLAWIPIVGDKATVNPTYWLFTMDDFGGATTCFTDTKNVTGIVASNATGYIDGPPSFNQATQTLDYKVAATHYLPDGKTPFLGTYDLVLRADVARCIYGFTDAPIGATVSVVSAEGGEQMTAVTSVSQANGWIHLSASGFTFSSPTVKVKLTGVKANGAQSEATKSTQQAAPATGTPVVRTITCMKGTALKKVTGVAAVCPSGYQRATQISCIKGKTKKNFWAAATKPQCPTGWKKG